MHGLEEIVEILRHDARAIQAALDGQHQIAQAGGDHLWRIGFAQIARLEIERRRELGSPFARQLTVERGRTLIE